MWHRFWSQKDKQKHINHLKLLAVFHALRCFASDLRDCEILLSVNNSSQPYPILIAWAPLNSLIYLIQLVVFGIGTRIGTFLSIQPIFPPLKTLKTQNFEQSLKRPNRPQKRAIFAGSNPVLGTLILTCLSLPLTRNVRALFLGFRINQRTRLTRLLQIEVNYNFMPLPHLS